MSTVDTEPIVAARPAARPGTRLWLGLSFGAVALAAAGNIGALLSVGRTYGETFPSLTDQAVAQDIVDLVVVVPLLVVTGVLAWRGSLRAYLAWLGALLFTVYNYVIYTFSVHFGPLFLAWVGVLGLAVYALGGGALALRPETVTPPGTRTGPRSVAWFLIGTAALFGLIWLGQIVPALAAGTVPVAVSQIGTPTNPVHVLDLALVLPAVAIAGVALLRGRASGLLAAPPMLLFLALTAAPILVTPIVAQARGHDAQWTVAGPIAAIAAASVWCLLSVQRAVRETPP